MGVRYSRTYRDKILCLDLPYTAPSKMYNTQCKQHATLTTKKSAIIATLLFLSDFYLFQFFVLNVYFKTK